MSDTVVMMRPPGRSVRRTGAALLAAVLAFALLGPVLVPGDPLRAVLAQGPVGARGGRTAGL